MEQEIWKDIPEYEGLYQISSHGRVKSIEKDVVIPIYGGIRHQQEKILKDRVGKGGYYVAQLCKPKTLKMFKKIHRLVAISFIPNPENKKQVNHIDGDKSNNKVWNLEWATASENQRHRYTHLGQNGYWKGKKIPGGAPNAMLCRVVDTSTNIETMFKTQLEISIFLKLSRAAIWKAIKLKSLVKGRYRIYNEAKVNEVKI